MAQSLSLELTSEQKRELEAVRDRHRDAYMRERAAALLKIAAGCSPHQVARHGLLKPRDPDTVYAWYHRYVAEGIAGLRIRPGRGRPRPFPPRTAAQAREVIEHIIVPRKARDEKWLSGRCGTDHPT